jgi:adenosine deaminase
VNLRGLPKIDLHRHLEGSVRFSTLKELVRDVGLKIPDAELRRRSCMKGEKPGFRRFLSKFEIFRGLYPSRDWIERVAFEACEDAKADGVVYLELRFSPTHFGRRLGAKGEDVAEWVRRGARRAKLPVNFIATFGRDFGVKGNEPTTRAVEGTDVFAGLDLAGDESVPAEPFRRLFKRLDLPCTIHAGEGGPAANVREAIEKFGARRIGHGIRAFRDRAVMELAWKKNVCFEVCPSSEIQTGAARSWERHPAWRISFPVMAALCTDDPSVCGTTLSGELARARAAGWATGTILLAAALVPATHAFAGRAEVLRLHRLVRSPWLSPESSCRP